MITIYLLRLHMSSTFVRYPLGRGQPVRAGGRTSPSLACRHRLRRAVAARGEGSHSAIPASDKEVEHFLFTRWQNEASLLERLQTMPVMPDPAERKRRGKDGQGEVWKAILAAQNARSAGRRPFSCEPWSCCDLQQNHKFTLDPEKVKLRYR